MIRLKLILAGVVVLVVVLLGLGAHAWYAGRQEAAFLKGQLAQKIGDDTLADRRWAVVLDSVRTLMQRDADTAVRVIEHFHTIVTDTGFTRLPVAQQRDSALVLLDEQRRVCTNTIISSLKFRSACDSSLAAKDKTIADLTAANVAKVGVVRAPPRRLSLGAQATYGPQWHVGRRPTWGLTTGVGGQWRVF